MKWKKSIQNNLKYVQLGDSDEEEYISDQNESDNEDVNAEFDISPTSEDEMENMKIWFEDNVGLLQVGGERVVGGDLLPFLHLYHRQETHDLCTATTGRPTTSAPLPLAAGPTTSAPLPPTAGPTTSALLPPETGRLTTSASPSHMTSGSTPPPSEPVHADDETSHHEGEGSYNETMQAVWINEGGIIDSQSIQIGYVLDLHRQPLQEQISNILCSMFEEMPKEASHPEANVHTSGSVSFATHKVRLESYSRGMDERYGDDSQRPELDLDIWVTASGAPKKGHVYGFGHSLGTARVISSCSSSVSHATSPFTTPAAPGGSSSAAPTMTPDLFREIVNETASQNISTIVSQTVSHYKKKRI
ncbi:hypothetical protein Taro_056278 [Colocasia esculenta]|uniref:Uncharacterized protein n=1 Tax=Colocasia esculenta TaxID=4460 RepID=A0A843XWT9_COLES|nr:hypothetical protein [Colocasia esculenta]